MKKKIGLYCGSFNPFHIGHLNVFNKAEEIFGKGNVIIGIGANPEKMLADTSDLTDRVIELRSALGTESVMWYQTFLHELIDDLELDGLDVTLIRGLRNGDDLAYEANQLKFIHTFKNDVKTIFILCDPEFAHISSSAIRNLEKFRKGSSKKFVV